MKKKIKSIFEMRYFIRKAGKLPGHLEQEYATFEPASVEMIRYNKDHFSREPVKETAFIEKPMDQSLCNWIDIVGLQDMETIQQLGRKFSLHALTLEDIINADHLPKCEFTEEQLFFTLKYPQYDARNDELTLKHISLILSDHYLLTIQEGRQDLLEPIKKRIEHAQGKVRAQNIEYLFYALTDFIVDQYFFIMDMIRDQIEDTEDLMIDEPETNHIQRIHLIKKRIVYLRKFISSLNKAVAVMQGQEIRFNDENIKFYMRDIYDHTVHINEALTTSKELQTTLLEMNMANISNSMNRVMKTLTIVATIFIPLTFLVGIYGMNFQNMPELTWQYGYPAVWGAILTIALIMIFYMKRKDWF
jgi:magnesium transporter